VAKAQNLYAVRGGILYWSGYRVLFVKRFLVELMRRGKLLRIPASPLPYTLVDSIEFNVSEKIVTGTAISFTCYCGK
jgi:hypothetical protein